MCNAAMVITVVTAASRGLAEMQRLCQQFDRQTFQNFEHIVVYDGPPPSDVQVFFSKQGDGRVRFDWLSAREGRYGTAPRNRGIELSKGQWIVFADDDDLYHPDYLAAFRDLNLADNELGVVRMNNYGTVVPRHAMKEFPRHAHVGTPCCAFHGETLRKSDDLRWTYDGGYDHDFQFVTEYVRKTQPRIRLNPRVLVKAGNSSLFDASKLSGKRLKDYLNWHEPNAWMEYFSPAKSDCWLHRKMNSLGKLFVSYGR
jgi:glycosyltransferase involved in cell wall biosynthesis